MLRTLPPVILHFLPLRSSLATPPSIPQRIWRNWAGDDVLVVSARGQSLGTEIDRITATFDEAGLLLPPSLVQPLSLDCSVASHNATLLELERWQQEAEQAQGETRGHLIQPFSSPLEAQTQPPSSTSPSTGCFTPAGQNETLCGCRVAGCAQGQLAADAISWATRSEIGFINAGAIRATLPRTAVTSAALSQMLPFLNEVVTVTLPGSSIRAALAHSISALAPSMLTPSPSGRFLQISSTLRFEWNFDGEAPTLRPDSIAVASQDPYRVGSPPANFTALDDSRFYKVAFSAFLGAGGDGFSMLASSRLTHHGFSEATATGSFLAGVAPSAASPFSLLLPHRIFQQPDTIFFYLGILCPVPRVTSLFLDRQADPPPFLLQLVL